MAPRAPDWEYLESLEPEELEEEDLARVASQLEAWEPGEGRAATAFLLLRAVLATRQEEAEEALQQLEEVEEVREENKRLATAVRKMKDKHGDREAGIEELLELERSLEEARRLLAAQTREAEREKEEREELEAAMEELEQDRKKMKRHVSSLEADLEEGRQREEPAEAALPEAEVEVRRLKELEDNMRLKNKQIHQLLEDIEQLEKDNDGLQDKMGGLRDELAEATGHIQLITGEYAGMRAGQADSARLLDTLQTDNAGLQTRLEDQYRERDRRDQQIQQIGSQVDDKVEEMKSIVNFKDAQIEELRSRLNRAVVTRDIVSEGEASRQAVTVLGRAVKERDAELESLQGRLQEAAAELESSAATIEELRGSGRAGGDSAARSLLAARADLAEAGREAVVLREHCAEAEEAARDKAEELSEAVSRLRQYEAGEYGLEQAAGEAAQLRRTVRARDLRVVELIMQADSLQLQAGEAGEENRGLRERLGLRAGPEEGQEAAGPSGRGQEERALVAVLQGELDRLEEDRLALKTENRRLARQCGARAAGLGLEPGDLAALQQYTLALRRRRQAMGGQGDVAELEAGEAGRALEEVARLKKELEEQQMREGELGEEVEKLRVGLHEILDSVREQDGRSDVVVSYCTE
jgi:chromosome segregation ATPase